MAALGPYGTLHSAGPASHYSHSSRPADSVYFPHEHSQHYHGRPVGPQDTAASYDNGQSINPIVSQSQGNGNTGEFTGDYWEYNPHYSAPQQPTQSQAATTSAYSTSLSGNSHGATNPYWHSSQAPTEPLEYSPDGKYTYNRKTNDWDPVKPDALTQSKIYSEDGKYEWNEAKWDWDVASQRPNTGQNPHSYASPTSTYTGAASRPSTFQSNNGYYSDQYNMGHSNVDPYRNTQATSRDTRYSDEEEVYRMDGWGKAPSSHYPPRPQYSQPASGYPSSMYDSQQPYGSSTHAGSRILSGQTQTETQTHDPTGTNDYTWGSVAQSLVKGLWNVSTWGVRTGWDAGVWMYHFMTDEKAYHGHAIADRIQQRTRNKLSFDIDGQSRHKKATDTPRSPYHAPGDDGGRAATKARTKRRDDGSVIVQKLRWAD